MKVPWSSSRTVSDGADSGNGRDAEGERSRCAGGPLHGAVRPTIGSGPTSRRLLSSAVKSLVFFAHCLYSPTNFEPQKDKTAAW